jgi:hypothetical protein
MAAILALLCACIAVDEVASDKLEFVSIVFRHGDRSPVDTFPTDPYKEDSWPQGFGQLSLIGMKQEYYLGEVIRDRYIESGYMSSNYNRSQIYVRSTDFDRTLISAQCVLGGLYPPTPDQVTSSTKSLHVITLSSSIGIQARITMATNTSSYCTCGR